MPHSSETYDVLRDKTRAPDLTRRRSRDVRPRDLPDDMSAISIIRLCWRGVRRTFR